MTEEMIRRCKKRNKIVLITLLTLFTIAMIGSLIWIYATETEEDPYETLTAEERMERFRDNNPESTTYLVTDNCISRVRPNTSYEVFLSKFDKDEVKVYYDVNCLNEVTSGNIASGMYAKYEENGKVYPISVLGDLKLADKDNSVGLMGSETKADSDLNEIECTRLIRAAVGDEKWKITEELPKKSADINCNNEIDKGDIRQILNYMVYGNIIVPEVEKIQAPVLNIIAGYENEDGSYEGRATIQFTQKQENGTRNIYRIVEKGNEYIEVANNGEIELSEAGDYTIIAYTYGPDGNKSKCSVKTLTLKPGLYTLTLVAGDNVTQTQGGGTYKVGDIVPISASLVEPTLEREIIWQGWTADNNLLDNQSIFEQQTEIVMPKGNVTLTASALSRDCIKPRVTAEQTGYNSFNWSAEDGGGISGYAITHKNEVPTEWIETGDLTQGTITVTEPGAYYIWAKDFDGNINEPVYFNAYAVNKVQTNGGNLNLRINGTTSTTGIPVENNAVVLAGTVVYAEVIADAGYSLPVLYKNNFRVTNGHIFTIEEDTTFSTSISTNDITINIQENGEDAETQGYKVSLSTSETMDTETLSATTTGTSVVFDTVPNGTYYVFASKSDVDKETKIYSGASIEVNDNKTQCTINYYGLTLVPGTGIISVSNGGYNTSNEIKYLYDANNRQAIEIDATVDVANAYTWNKWAKTSEYNMVLSENIKYQSIQMPAEQTILTAYTVGAKYGEYENGNSTTPINTYLTLADAFANAEEGHIIKAIGEADGEEEQIAIPEGKSVTIDLNGGTLNISHPIINNGTLTIIDSSNTDGKIQAIGEIPAIINNGTLNLGTNNNQEYTNGATIEGGTNGIVNNSQTGTINFYDGTIIGNNGEGSSIVDENGKPSENIIIPDNKELSSFIENDKEITKISGHAKFKPGKEVNTAIKKLVNGDPILVSEDGYDYYVNENGYYYYYNEDNTVMLDGKISQIIRYPGTDLPNDINPINVATDDSEEPIYAWSTIDSEYHGVFDSYNPDSEYDIIYWWSPDSTPALNEDASHMFEALEACIVIDCQYFDTSDVTDMSHMFEACAVYSIDFEPLEQLLTPIFKGDAEALHMSEEAISMLQAFVKITMRHPFDISGFDTSNVTTMENMFCNGGGIINILDVSHFDTSNVTNMKKMFYSACRSSIDRYGLDVSNFDTSKVTDMSEMFYYCDGLVSLDVSNFNTSNVTDMSNMFGNCRRLTELDVSNFNTSNVTNMADMFAECEEVTELDVSHFDTRNVTNMERMFYECEKIEILDVSNFNTSNVTNMERMFYDCEKIEILDVSGFDTSNVTDMSAMFLYCKKVKNLDVSNFDTSKVTDMDFMFGVCTLLETLDVSGFDTSNVTDMHYMFGDCETLETLDVSSFDTSKVTDMKYMFDGCKSIEVLDLTNFDTSKVTDMYRMFYGMREYELKTIYASPRFIVNNGIDTAQMFEKCTKLVGGNGTTYNSNHIDGEYARIDGWDGLPGYFSVNTEVFKFAEYDENNQCINIYASLEDAVAGLTDGNILVLPADVTLTSDENTIVITGNVTIDLNGHTLTTNKPIQNNGVFTLIDSTNTDGKLQSTGNNPAIINNGTLNIGTIDNQEYTYGATIEGATNGIVNNEPTGVINIYDGTVIGNNGEGSSIVNQDGNQAENIVTPTGYELETTIENGKETAILVGQAIFKTGKEINTIMRELASGNQLEFPEDEEEMNEEELETWYAAGELITAIKKYPGTEIPQSASPVNVETLDSAKPIYMWFDNGTIYWFSTDETPKLNEDASYMFFYLENCTEIDSQYFDTKSVTNMAGLCLYCKNLTNLEVSGFKTDNVTTMKDIFAYCESLTSLDVSGFNTRNVQNMSGMFDNCGSLTSLNVSRFDTRNVTDMSSMFSGCENLTGLDVSNFVTGNVVSMNYMFSRCENLTRLDVSKFDTRNVVDMGWMFSLCENLTSLDVSKFNTSNVQYMNGMFDGCKSLTSLELSNFNTSNVQYMNAMFAGCESLTSLDVTVFNTNNVINMSEMFDGCSGLTELDMTNFETNNVTDISKMFFGCENLETIDVSNFNTSNVTDMSYIFYECKMITSLDLTNWDTSQVTTMRCIFWDCNNLTELDLSTWDTSSVKSMYEMFGRCFNLTELNLANFDTSNVTNMSMMFSNCNNLKNLDISNFDTRKVTTMFEMFAHCENLEKIYAGPDYNTDLVTTNRLMAFYGCDKLEGENGTNLSNVYSSNSSLNYARIDGLNGIRGYFSINKDIYKYGEYDSDNKLVNIYKTQEEANAGVTAGNTISAL